MFHLGYSFGVVRASVHPHFVSVRNHISVPIGQFFLILGINDITLELLSLFKYMEFNAKPI